MLAVAAVGLLVAWLSPGDTASVRTSEASNPGVVDLVAIDTQAYRCNSNTATFIDNIDWGVHLDIGESTEIDIVVDEVDPADGLSGFGADLIYNGAIIEVAAYDDEFLLGAAGPRTPTTSTDPLPDYDSDFRFDSGDLSTNFEDGKGVLARITITCLANGISSLSLDDVVAGDHVPDILDAGGAALSLGTVVGGFVGCGVSPVPSWRDFGILEESVVGPGVISGGTGDYVIETTIRNDGTHYDMDGLITTEIMPPPDCDVGAGPGSLHTIVTPVLEVPECTPQAVDVPFQVQCSAPGVQEFDFQIWNEIEPDPSCQYCPPNADLSDDMVSHEGLPGAPPPLTLDPAGSPGPGLRVTVVNCVPEPSWPLPVGDTDCDGWTDADEGTIGTDPTDDCPDDPTDDAWPSDFDMNAVVNLADLFNVLPPYFGSSPSNPDTNGDTVPDWSPRRDLVPDGFINLADVFMVLPPYFGSSCT